MSYDLIIIGGGPAGVAAGVYAARKKLKTLFLTVDFGGQSVVSPEVQNWISTKAISGEDLAKQLKEHLFVYRSQDFTIIEGESATGVSQENKNFAVATAGGQNFSARAVLVTSGASRRKLEVTGAKEFEQKGITYCATCDGPLFAGKDVVVIGGGNAGFETAAQLLAYCRSVTLIHRSEQFRADAITIEKVKRNPKMKIITNAETQEFRGDKFVRNLIYKDLKTGETKELATEGVFVEIGLVPNTWFIKDLVKLNQYNSIIVDPRTQAASVPGIWAAGDCADGLYHQNNIAAGDAIKAVENIYQYLHQTS